VHDGVEYPLDVLIYATGFQWMATSTFNMITGRDGRTIRHRLPRIAVEIQGHLIEPETGVAWLTDDDAERALEGQLAGVMAPLIDQHRAEVASAGGDPARLRALRDEYEGIYFRALLGAVPAWRDLGRSQAQEEAAGQAGTPLVSGAPDVRRVDMVETARRMRITQALPHSLRGELLASEALV
jgi:hypothetical protein